MDASRRFFLQGLSSLLLLPMRALAATATTRDRRGRLIAPVYINGRGPFRFALDTAATLTMVSSELAADLHLKTSADTVVLIHGSAGQQTSNLVNIDRLELDGLIWSGRQLGVIQAGQLAEVDGLLSADCLQGQQLDIQMRAALLSIRAGDADAVVASAPTIASRVVVERRFESLLALSTRIGRTSVQAILDTGAQRSVGNLALQKALGLHTSDDVGRTAVLTSVDGSAVRAAIVATPAMQLGTVGLAATDILYADLSVFQQWGYAKRPAMLLGMDLLGQLGRVLVDYRRTRVHVWK